MRCDGGFTLTFSSDVSCFLESGRGLEEVRFQVDTRHSHRSKNGSPGDNPDGQGSMACRTKRCGGRGRGRRL